MRRVDDKTVGQNRKVEGCVHHWVVDSRDVGRCLKCGKVKDFRRALGTACRSYT
jgi:hypothetical protein